MINIRATTYQAAHNGLFKMKVDATFFMKLQCVEINLILTPVNTHVFLSFAKEQLYN